MYWAGDEMPGSVKKRYKGDAALADSLLANAVCIQTVQKRNDQWLPRGQLFLWMEECRAEPVPSSGHQLDILAQAHCSCWKESER